MAAVAIVGVPCSGHDCYPPRPSVESNNATVFVNGIPVHTVGDFWPAHICDDDAHIGIVASGSAKTFVNGKPVARIGDGIGGGCLSIISAGSGNVYCGG